ncbi:MAG: hypothetical protein ABI573_11770 [Chloroflexota bacterium]
MTGSLSTQVHGDLPLGVAVPSGPGAEAIAEMPSTALDSTGRPWPVFAHASEAEMARILDFYTVRWDYEPRTFPILWNLDGAVIESFSPDFYLPELDLYLEMTTLKQRLVRKKNRKLRRLRELYPAINIKLFYARDFRAMLLKYGRLALADSLSGTLGQISPERPQADPSDLSVLPAPVDGRPSVAEHGPNLTAAPSSKPLARSGTVVRRRRSRRAAARGEDMLSTTDSTTSGDGPRPVAIAGPTTDQEAPDYR